MSKKAPRRHTGAIVVMILLMLAFIAGTAFVIKLCLDIPNQDVTVSTKPGSAIVLPTAPEQTEAPRRPPRLPRCRSMWCPPPPFSPPVTC